MELGRRVVVLESRSQAKQGKTRKNSKMSKKSTAFRFVL